MGSSNQQTPQPYQLPNQAGSATALQAGASELQTVGNDIYSALTPQYAGITANVANNPYYNQAQTGAQAAAGQATGTVAPQQFGGAAQDTGIAGMATAAAPQYAAQANAGGQAGYAQTQSMIPSALAGLNLAPQQLQYLTSLLGPTTLAGLAQAPQALSQGFANAGQSYGQSQQALGQTQGYNANLMGAANQTLNTAYDPQQALYNRSYQQMLEQTNAINAQNGVTGSPFAAGVGAENANNFNIDWQNAQLARQEGALGAYGTAAGTATGDVNSTLATGANDYTALSNAATNQYTGLTSNAVNNATSLVNSGVGNFNTLTNSAVNNVNSLVNTGTGALNAGINTGVGALNTLGNQAVSANAAASDLGVAGLQTLSSAAQAPSATYLAQQQAQLAATQAQEAGQISALAPFQQGTADQTSYLSSGQNAASVGSNVAAANNTAQNGFIGNILSGASTIASVIPW